MKQLHSQEKKNRLPKSTALRFLSAALCVVFMTMLVLGLCSCEKKFKTNKEYLAYVSDKMIDESFSATTNEELKDGKSMTVTANVAIGNVLKNLLSSSLGDADESAYIVSLIAEYLDNIDFNFSTAKKDGSHIYDIGISLDKQDIISIVAAIDASGKLSGIRVPELSDKWLLPDLSDYIEGDTAIAGSTMIMENMKQILNVLSDTEALKKGVKDIRDIALNAVPDENIVKAEKQTLTVGELSQECNTVTITLNAEEFKDVIYKIIDELAENEEIRNFIISMSQFISTDDPDGYTDDEKVEKIVSLLKEAVDDMAEELASASESFSLVIYIDKDFNVIGTNANLFGKTAVYCASLNSGNKFVENVKLTDSEGELLTVDIDLTEANGKLSGKANIKQGENDLVYIDIENIDKKAAEKGNFSGSITITLSNYLASIISENDETGMMSFLGSMLSFKLTGTSTADVNEISYAVLFGKEELVTFKLKLTRGSAEGFELPTAENTITDAEKWVETISFDGIIAALKKTTLPQDIIDLVESLLTYSGAFAPAA
ncbi:MAG: hypothetical protein ACI4QR_06965 [Eubacteriales bacterium]